MKIEDGQFLYQKDCTYQKKQATRKDWIHSWRCRSKWILKAFSYPKIVEQYFWCLVYDIAMDYWRACDVAKNKVN